MKKTTSLTLAALLASSHYLQADKKKQEPQVQEAWVLVEIAGQCPLDTNYDQSRDVEWERAVGDLPRGETRRTFVLPRKSAGALSYDRRRRNPKEELREGGI